MSSIDIQVAGETLVVKNHNQIIQNVTRKILFNMQKTMIIIVNEGKKTHLQIVW